MMDDSALTHKRRKLVKTYKNVLPRKRTVDAKVCGESYSKNVIKWSRKTTKHVIYPTGYIKGNAERNEFK